MDAEHSTITQLQTSQNTEETMSVRDLLSLCLVHWHWFIISLIACIGLAAAYLLVTIPTYTSRASILIKEDSKGQSISSSTVDAISNLGLIQTNTNVINEISQLESRDMMETVVRRLGLNVTYYREGRFHREVTYGTALPVKISFADSTAEAVGSLQLRLAQDGSVLLSDFRNAANEDKSDFRVKVLAGEGVRTPLGYLTVYPTSHYSPGQEETLHIVKNSVKGTVTACLKKLTVSLKDDKGTVIDMTYKDPSTQRAEDALNTLIQVYNENWVMDKNQVTVSTSEFINDRLVVIENELGSVDSDISSFKSTNLIPDIQAATNLYMSESSQNNSQILTLSNQMSMAKFVRNYLTSNTNKNQFLPANSGIENVNIEQQIAQYNEMLLQRNNILSSSSERNPLVVDLDASLKSMETSILASIDNYIETLNISLQNVRQNDARNKARIASNPSQAQHLLSVERQQKVKEALYLYLLQKREENEVSQAFTAYNTRIVTAPNSDDLPTAPVKRNILLVAFFLGILIPAGIIFLIETMNTTVRGRQDLEKLTVPFLGEIPLWADEGKSHKTLRTRNSRKKRQRAFVVKTQSRDVINEAFRVLRTNLEFVTGSDPNQHVIAVTSINAGSGKSYLSANLAASLAIKGRKVLVIDGDLRFATCSAYVGFPSKGLADYLAEQEDDYTQLIVEHKTFAGLSILPVGTIPPNPTELLESERFAHLIAQVRDCYDYVIIDCPPVEVVADTHIIEKHTGRTIFIVRAGMLERSMTADIEALYTEKKLKNMAIVLNGTLSAGGYGRYSYHYGYGYKYVDHRSSSKSFSRS